MYTLVSAIAKPRTGDRRWISVSIGSVALRELLATYSSVIATLNNSFLSANVAFNLSNLTASAALAQTFNQFLSANGSTALTTSNTLPTLSPKYAKYADGFRAGYKIEAVARDVSPDVVYPEEDKIDLLMSKPGVDYSLFFHNCLVNVNGFYHRIDAGAGGVTVRDGMKSQHISHEANIGILSFREMAPITCIPITDSMIYKQRNDQLMRDRAYVNLGIDVSNKTVMLVLGGYLHVLDPQTFYRVSDKAFAIDFGNLQLVDRFFESRKYIDLSSLGLAVSSRNADQVGIGDLYSDRSLTAYLKLSQTFFVVMDKPDIFVQRQALRAPPTPNLYYGPYLPVFPLIVGAGKVANYWYDFEDGMWSYSCVDSLHQNYLFRTTDYKNVGSVSNQRVPGDLERPSYAYLQQIGCDF